MTSKTPPNTDDLGSASPATETAQVGPALNGETEGPGEEWDQKNARRIQLAKKKNRQGLTPEEQAELDDLQQRFFAYLESKHPRPPLGAERLDEIEARLRGAKGPANGQ